MSAASPGRSRVVALGGGHGLAATLAALRMLPLEITAVVTVADDGGSSGRLRAELGALPPGDLRMALAALAGGGPGDDVAVRLLQHRFAGTGGLAGHAVGNLLIAGLMELLGDPVAALDAAAAMVGSRGRVLPVSTEPMDIVADVADSDRPDVIREVRGQVAVATARGPVLRVRPLPPRPAACRQAVQAIDAADWVVLGPGSWFTSVLPHLLVPEIGAALTGTPARRLVVLNLAAQSGETTGFAPQTYLEVLAAYGPELTVDAVLADPATVPDVNALRHAATALGAELVLASVRVPDRRPAHDPIRLAAAFTDLLGTSTGVGPWR